MEEEPQKKKKVMQDKKCVGKGEVGDSGLLGTSGPVLGVSGAETQLKDPLRRTKAR